MNIINDLIEISKQKKADIPLLMMDSYKRGLFDGKELAKNKIIEAIQQEK